MAKLAVFTAEVFVAKRAMRTLNMISRMKTVLRMSALAAMANMMLARSRARVDSAPESIACITISPLRCYALFDRVCGQDLKPTWPASLILRPRVFVFLARQDFSYNRGHRERLS